MFLDFTVAPIAPLNTNPTPIAAFGMGPTMPMQPMAPGMVPGMVPPMGTVPTVVPGVVPTMTAMPTGN